MIAMDGGPPSATTPNSLVIVPPKQPSSDTLQLTSDWSKIHQENPSAAWIPKLTTVAPAPTTTISVRIPRIVSLPGSGLGTARRTRQRHDAGESYASCCGGRRRDSCQVRYPSRRWLCVLTFGQ